MMPQTTATPPRVIYNSQQIHRGIDRMAAGILERNGHDLGRLGLIGIHGGGGILAQRFMASLARQAGQPQFNLDIGMVDIGLYRDDYSRLSQMPQVRATIIDFDVDQRELVLLDDVIFTGRTTRAAMESLFSLGRPARVYLAVLVDRGHREFPIQPHAVGYQLATDRHQSVNVYLSSDPNEDYATLEDYKYDL